MFIVSNTSIQFLHIVFEKKTAVFKNSTYDMSSNKSS